MDTAYVERYCPADRLLAVVSAKWMAQLLWLLERQGAMRFGQLRKELAGISPRVLSDRLRWLEREGFLLRQEQGGEPPYALYELSDRGRALADVVDRVVELAVNWRAEDGEDPASPGP